MRTESGITDKNLIHIKKNRSWAHGEAKADCQHGFTRGESCLTNLISFYDKFPGFLAERRVVGVIYLDFNKAFDIMSHNNLVSKIRH